MSGRKSAAASVLVIGGKTLTLTRMRRLLPLLLFAASCAAVADTGEYLVEVIVLRNLAVPATAQPIEELRAFSRFPGLQAPMPERTLDAQRDGDAGLPASADLPDGLQPSTQRSGQMDEVWRRLRSSRDYRPLVYAAWRQNRIDYYPPVRVHDGERIDTQLRPPTDVVVADLSAADPLAAYRSDFYRVDGAVQLRRSRFLHLYLDLEYRVDMPPALAPAGATGFSATGAPGPPAEGSYGVFALKQNRQIRSGQLQYFDTPFFGALVLVSAIEPAEGS